MGTPEPAGKGEPAQGKGSRSVDVAWLMLGSVALGVVSGLFLDRRFHSTQHLFLLGGSLIGVVAGFTSLVYAIQRLDK